MFPRKLLVGIPLCVLVALSFLLSACADKRPITQQEVSVFLEEMDKAAQHSDVETIASHLSSNFHTRVVVDGYGPTVTLDCDRDQYLAQTKQGFATTTSYSYKRGKTIINLDPDGQTAYVADEIFETVNVSGNLFTTVSRSTSVLKREGSKLVLTSTIGVAHVSTDASADERASIN